MNPLYEMLPNGQKRCVVCGKIIFWAGVNGTFATKSHARKHVREGKAIEVHVPSSRSYAGFEIDFDVVEKVEEDLPMPEREEDFSDSRFER